MTNHPNAGGLGINWLIFGSSHHEKRPKGGVLENFTMCAEQDFSANHHIKTICDPARALNVDVHHVDYLRGFYSLDENGERIYGPVTEAVHFDKIRINHYFCKSLEEYTTIKMERGDVFWGATQKKIKSFQHHDQNVITDTEILSHV